VADFDDTPRDGNPLDLVRLFRDDEREAFEALGHVVLSPDARLVWIALVLRRDNESKRCFPGYPLLMADTGITRRERITNALRELRHMGMVRARRRFGKSTLYELLPVEPEPPESVRPRATRKNDPSYSSSTVRTTGESKVKKGPRSRSNVRTNSRSTVRTSDSSNVRTISRSDVRTLSALPSAYPDSAKQVLPDSVSLSQRNGRRQKAPSAESAITEGENGPTETTLSGNTDPVAAWIEGNPHRMARIKDGARKAAKRTGHGTTTRAYSMALHAEIRKRVQNAMKRDEQNP
jgi:hypothetical protein